MNGSPVSLIIACALLASCACVSGPASPCRSQCELAAGSCEERPITEFADYETELATWRTQAEGGPCEDAFPFSVAGTCDDGKTFLYLGTGFTTLVQYYSGATGRFVGLETQTDVSDPVCNGAGYWPEPVACAGATVTEVICGTQFEVGGEVVLP